MARRSSMISALLPENRNRSPLSAFAGAEAPWRWTRKASATLAGSRPTSAASLRRRSTVAHSCGAAHCRPAFAADPQRRARLLHRLGGEQNVRKLDEAAVEPRLVLRPQLAKRHQI